MPIGVTVTVQAVSQTVRRFAEALMQVNLPDGMFYVTPGYCSDSGLCHRHMRCRSTRQ